MKVGYITQCFCIQNWLKFFLVFNLSYPEIWTCRMFLRFSCVLAFSFSHQALIISLWNSERIVFCCFLGHFPAFCHYTVVFFCHCLLLHCPSTHFIFITAVRLIFLKDYFYYITWLFNPFPWLLMAQSIKCIFLILTFKRSVTDIT